MGDDVLRQAISGVASLITSSQLINVRNRDQPKAPPCIHTRRYPHIHSSSPTTISNQLIISISPHPQLSYTPPPSGFASAPTPPQVDFADVRAVMEGGGLGMVTIGRASGESRALQAARAALSSPLLGQVTYRLLHDATYRVACGACGAYRACGGYAIRYRSCATAAGWPTRSRDVCYAIVTGAALLPWDGLFGDRRR